MELARTLSAHSARCLPCVAVPRGGVHHRIDLELGGPGVPCTSSVAQTAAHTRKALASVSVPGPDKKFYNNLLTSNHLVRFPVLSQIKPQAPVLKWIRTIS